MPVNLKHFAGATLLHGESVAQIAKQRLWPEPIFFGCFCIVVGYLIYRLGYLPKVLGILMQIAGLSYLINSFALVLAPIFANRLFPAVLVPAFVGDHITQPLAPRRRREHPTLERAAQRADNVRPCGAGEVRICT
jgi:hypothetical protein